jgi:hypothetical protein
MSVRPPGVIAAAGHRRGHRADGLEGKLEGQAGRIRQRDGKIEPAIDQLGDQGRQETLAQVDPGAV